jgi:branched-chain amino acid transport system permease protein
MFQTLLSGLAEGSIYGLVALGFGLIFYVTRVINFAQGQILMVGTMVTAVAADSGWPVALAVIMGIVAATLACVLVYAIAVKPVLAFDRFSYAWLVTTLGMALLLENVAAIMWGTTSQPFPNLLNGSSIHIAGAVLTGQELLSIVLVVVLAAAVELARRHTLLGKVGIATAIDPEMAAGVGINPTLVAIGAFLVAGFVTGVAGVLVGPRTFGNPYLGDTYGIDGFVALMIGGIDWPIAGVVGGLILGVLQEVATNYINTEASSWFPFAVVVAVLLVLPRGLFSIGNPIERLGRLVPRRGTQVAGS